MRTIFILGSLILLSSCFSKSTESSTTQKFVTQYASPLDSIFDGKEEWMADGFDFPVGKPDAKNYYNAQPFGQNNHLGDDWNGTGGGNTDLGDPIYSIGNGFVSFAEDIGGGWGNVVRVIHRLPDSTYIESLYAHQQEMMVKEGDWIKKGQQLGTIGNANGVYYAHLHLEIRDTPNLKIGGGYSNNTTGYVDPTVYIKANRTIDD